MSVVFGDVEWCSGLSTAQQTKHQSNPVFSILFYVIMHTVLFFLVQILLLVIAVQHNLALNLLSDRLAEPNGRQHAWGVGQKTSSKTWNEYSMVPI